MRSTSQPASASFATGSQDRVEYKILISQEVLNERFLATNLMFICTEHLPEVLDRYFEALDPVFALMRQCEDGKDVMDLLNSPVCHGDFRRLI